MDEILQCDHWIKSYSAVLSCDTVYYALQGGLQGGFNIRVWMKSYNVTIQLKVIQQYFPVMLFIMLYKVVLTFESVDDNL